MTRRAINDVPALGPVLGPYSRAVWAGDILYMAGQLGIDSAAGELVQGGVAAETQQLLNGLSAVLAAAGLSMGDVVKANVFLTDMADFAAMNKIYETFFEAPYPARSTIGVAALPAGARVEIELVAAAK